MKYQNPSIRILLPCLFLGALSPVAYAYPLARVVNNTEYTVSGEVQYISAFCRDDTYNVGPGQTWEASSRGGCLIDGITGNISEGARHGESTSVVPYDSTGTSYSVFQINAHGDRYRIFSEEEYDRVSNTVQGRSPGFYLVNKTDWPVAYSLEQTGCLYHDVVPRRWDNKDGVRRVDTGAVWFTLRVHIQPDGINPQTDWDCAEPVAEIVGDVLFATMTGGAGAAMAGPKFVAKTVAKEAIKSAIKASARSVTETMSERAGEYLNDVGTVTIAGQYAGYEWPFQCDDMPEYQITGGPELRRGDDGEIYVLPGPAFTVEKVNTCGDDMMLGSPKKGSADANVPIPSSLDVGTGGGSSGGTPSPNTPPRSTGYSAWAATDGVEPFVADFDGDGKDDIGLFRMQEGWGSSPVAYATGDGNWRITNKNNGAFKHWTPISGVQPILGEFDGDGRADVALVQAKDGWGSIPVAHGNSGTGWSITNGGTGGSFTRRWSPTSGVEPLVGDYDGDGKDDVALVRMEAGWGSIPVAFSAGGGEWRITNGGTGDSFTRRWSPTSGVEPLVGDYDGDGRDDVALVRMEAGWGSIPVALSAGGGEWRITNGGTGDSFTRRWSPTSGVRAEVGDYDGDGKDDVALVRMEAGWGSIPVAFSAGGGEWRITNGGAADFIRRWSSTPGAELLKGDFNGDGRTDFALVRMEEGWSTIPVALADGEGGWTIKNQSGGGFSSWTPISGVDPLVGDFNGDGRDDIALLRREDGWQSIPVAFGQADGGWRVTNGRTD